MINWITADEWLQINLEDKCKQVYARLRKELDWCKIKVTPVNNQVGIYIDDGVKPTTHTAHSDKWVGQIINAIKLVKSGY